MKRRTWALIVTATTLALLIGLVGAGTAAGFKGKGTQGCTPGYWKQPQHADSWPAAYSAGADWDATFGVNLLSPNKSLLQSLKPQEVGGATGEFVRHATAALLNASADVPVSFKWNPPEVIAIVQAAVSSGDLSGAAAMFVREDNRGCPLN